MFKKTKSKVLVDYASEEDDMSWHYHHSYKDKDTGEEEEEAIAAVAKEEKVKKMMSKKERKEKKMLSSKDDKHLLLSGVKVAERKVSNKKASEGEKEKDKPEKRHCFWDSVTMTMRQISPAKKLEKMEGWEPPQLGIVTETVKDEALIENGQNGEAALSLPPESISIPLEIPSWGGQGFEEDSSRYANLTDSNDPAVRWTARAKVKLAGISRMSRGIVSESPWGGFKQ